MGKSAVLWFLRRIVSIFVIKVNYVSMAMKTYTSTDSHDLVRYEDVHVWSTPNPKAQFRYIILIKHKVFYVFLKIRIRIDLSIQSKKNRLKNKQTGENLSTWCNIFFILLVSSPINAFELQGINRFISYCLIHKYCCY